MTNENQDSERVVMERQKPGPKPKAKEPQLDYQVFEEQPTLPPLLPIEEPGVLSIADLEDQFKEGGDKQAAKKTKDPFFGYKQTLVSARRYPKNPQLNQMSRDDLLRYCINNVIFKKGWVLDRGKTPDTHEMIVVKAIKTDDSREEILKYIDKRESITFPAHWLVFTTLTNQNPGLPHSLGLKSWYTNRFESVAFEMQWPLPTPSDPFRVAEKKNICTLVSDDSVRAQLLFMNKPVTGEVIRRQNGSNDAYYLLRLANDSIPILEKLYYNGTKGANDYADLRLWEKESGGLPGFGD